MKSKFKIGDKVEFRYFIAQRGAFSVLKKGTGIIIKIKHKFIKNAPVKNEYLVASPSLGSVWVNEGSLSLYKEKEKVMFS